MLVLGFRSDPEAEFATSVFTWQGLFLMGFSVSMFVSYAYGRFYINKTPDFTLLILSYYKTGTRGQTFYPLFSNFYGIAQLMDAQHVGKGPQIPHGMQL